jgi:hypothetical protein
MKGDVRVVGYCASCRYFRPYTAERPINHGQKRFGRCRLRILVDTPGNALCDRYQPPRDVGR